MLSLSEAVRFRRRERVFKSVELEEEVECQVTEGFVNGVGITGEDVEEVKEGCVEVASAVYALVKIQAKACGTFAVLKVSGDEMGECSRLGVAKSFLDAFIVWLKNLREKQLGPIIDVGLVGKMSRGVNHVNP